MNDALKLTLRDLEVECILGDLPEERRAPRTVRVEVTLTLAPRSAETDDLADGVDYAALVRAIRANLAAARCRLVERAAKVVADTCLAQTPAVRAVTATVVKEGTLPGLAAAVATWTSAAVCGCADRAQGCREAAD